MPRPIFVGRTAVRPYKALTPKTPRRGARRAPLLVFLTHGFFALTYPFKDREGFIKPLSVVVASK